MLLLLGGPQVGDPRLGGGVTTERPLASGHLQGASRRGVAEVSQFPRRTKRFTRPATRLIVCLPWRIISRDPAGELHVRPPVGRRRSGRGAGNDRALLIRTSCIMTTEEDFLRVILDDIN